MNEKFKKSIVQFPTAASIFGMAVFLTIYLFMPQPAPQPVGSNITCEEEMESVSKRYGSFEVYLKHEQAPKQIKVDGITHGVSERLAKLDCALVYGDFNDVPSDIQRLVGSEWLYVGYGEDGEPLKNVYVKKR